ncbi:uncharacterized protein LOC129002634 [Macrosteles quadrilineatus]|uniref:uncharacterized protein LOC129002634 n=1 Tax=Macrosteles quadrilineatus TaxID=74068 RepID=UPI0023E0B166|nr:uncharacterized protein LOC129002634 [Macrosteles quadrilineatus]
MSKKGRKTKIECTRSNNKKSLRPVKSINDDYIFIGKENMKKWNEMKYRFNCISDKKFISCLLNLISNENSHAAIMKCFEKEIENQPPNSLVSVEDNVFDHDKSVLIKPQSEETKPTDNSSSVIVINKAVVDGNNEDTLLIPYGPKPASKEKNERSLEDSAHNQNLIHRVDTKPPLENDIIDESSTKIKCHKGEDNNNSRNIKQKKKKSDHESKDKLVHNEERLVKLRKRKIKSFELSHEEVMKNSDDHQPTPNTKTEIVEPAAVPTAAAVNCALQISAEERVAITIRLCSVCEQHHLQEACPVRQPTRMVLDAVSLSEWTKAETTKGPSFAEASLPSCLELRVNDSQPGLSVVARQAIQPFVQFGPLVGRCIKEKDIPDDSTMEHIWELNDANGSQYLTTSDPNESNWLRYVHPAATRSKRNLEVVLSNHQLVFVTTSAISEGEELFFWAENTNNAWSHKKLNKTKCGGCNLSFSHTLYYRLHCTVFHDPSFSLTVRKYHCKVCGCSVLGKENIVKHAAEKHNGKGAYQCQFCNKFFLRLNYLEMHRTYGCSANPNRSRPLCDYCGRKFCQPQKLKVHIKRMHSEMLDVLRDFQCKHCLKILGSRPALQRHFKEVHQKDVVGAFTCDRCGKMFQNKSNLKIHMLTHSGIKPFKCREAECPAAFTTKQCLQFHYRKVHGLAEDSIPPIQRSVEYTFDAYAGGRRPGSVNSDSQCSSDGEDNSEKYANEPPLSPPISVTGDQSSQPAMDTLIVASKGSKKWIETNDAAKSNVFDFDEDDKDQDINVSHIDEEPIPMLFHNCKQDSANASLLVEAALDAAERDIDMPSKVPSPMSLVTNKESYPLLRSHIPHSPLGLSRPVSPVEYPIQDQSQSPHLAMESCYTTMSPRHPYSLMFPERTPHYDFRLSPPPGQIDSFHLEDLRYDHHRREDSNDGVNMVQNLSLLKKPMLDIPYKYDNMEERSFESVEGLDMSRTGYHHSFVSVTPRYPLYEPRSYSHTDVLRVVNFSHSVDLSLPRSHHQLTPPMNQSLIEPIRIISPPPYQTYPLTASPPSYTRPSHSPTYHHYNTSY